MKRLQSKREENLKPNKKGEKRRGGRVKGQPNKTTRLLKEAVILAAEQVGADGKGKDGLVGYLRHLAAAEPKAFVQLLARILPLQVHSTFDPENIREIVESMSPQEAAKAYAETLRAGPTTVDPQWGSTSSKRLDPRLH